MSKGLAMLNHESTPESWHTSMPKGGCNSRTEAEYTCSVLFSASSSPASWRQDITCLRYVWIAPTVGCGLDTSTCCEIGTGKRTSRAFWFYLRVPHCGIFTVERKRATNVTCRNEKDTSRYLRGASCAFRGRVQVQRWFPWSWSWNCGEKDGVGLIYYCLKWLWFGDFTESYGQLVVKVLGLNLVTHHANMRILTRAKKKKVAILF